jgi:thiamine-phosphate pyrophosphorylase
MKPIKNARLYVILDTGYVPKESLLDMARMVIRGGADILQLRAKNESDEEILKLAPPIRDLAAAAGAPLIINDRPHLAGQLDAAGVHIGQDDMTVADARKKLRIKAAVGKSTHSREQIEAAVLEKPDYIAVGPVYPTPTKPDYPPVGLELVRYAAEKVKIPFFCIGGIKLENVDDVLAAGARRIVVVSGILLAKDPQQVTKELKQKLAARRNTAG